MKVRTNMTLTDDLLERVRVEASKRGLSVSEVTQQALAWWLVLAPLRSNGTRIFVEEKGERKELILT